MLWGCEDRIERGEIGTMEEGKREWWFVGGFGCDVGYCFFCAIHNDTMDVSIDNHRYIGGSRDIQQSYTQQLKPLLTKQLEKMIIFKSG